MRAYLPPRAIEMRWRSLSDRSPPFSLILVS